MPGWTTGDNFHNNIAYTPGPWIALHRICEKHGVGDHFRIHYDPSHAILMGQDTRSIFQYLKDEGYGFLIGGFHVKGQVVDARGRLRVGIRRSDDGARRLERRQAVTESRRSGQRVEEADGALRARAARHGETRSAGVPAEPDGGLARPSARRARAAAARRRQHVPDRRARISEGTHSGSSSGWRQSFRRRSHSCSTSIGRRRACTRCSTKCSRRRGFPSQGIGREPYRS